MRYDPDRWEQEAEEQQAKARKDILAKVAAREAARLDELKRKRRMAPIVKVRSSKEEIKRMKRNPPSPLPLTYGRNYF